MCAHSSRRLTHLSVVEVSSQATIGPAPRRRAFGCEGCSKWPLTRDAAKIALPRMCRAESYPAGISRTEPDRCRAKIDPGCQPVAMQKEALTCCLAGQSLINSFC